MNKNIFLTALTIIVLYFSMQAQVPKKVLIEHFTNNSSGPSASQNPTFYSSIITPNSGDVIHIAFHTNTPGNDIFYGSDPAGVNSRYTLYGSTNIPFTALNGQVPNNVNNPGGQWNVYDGAPSGYTQTAIDNQAVITSELSVNTTHSFNTDFSQVEVSVVIKNESNFIYGFANSYLYVSLVNEELNYSTAPNSNGETQFLNVHRMFLPDENGQALTGSINAGDSITFSYTEATSPELLNLLEVKAVAFIQNTNTFQIVQAGESTPVSSGNYADLTLSDQTTYNDALCDSTLSGTLSIQNLGTAPVDSFDIEVSVNGITVLTQTIGTSIAAGGNTTINTDDFEIQDGSNTVRYEITQVYGNSDANSMNNNVASNQVIFLSEYADFIFSDGFENDNINQFAVLPVISTSPTANDNQLVYVVDQSVSGSVNWELGANESSSKSLLFDFYSSGLNEVAEIYYGNLGDIITIPENSVQLSFDYAYAQRSGFEDAFHVLSSGDCGSTWDTLFSEAGADLATSSKSPTGRFWPEASDWDSVQINLTALPTNIIKFVGETDRGSMLFLDNVSVDIINSTIEIIEENNISVYPNPTQNQFNIKTTSNEPTLLNIYSVTGQLVHSSQFTNSTQIDCSTWGNGVYFLLLDNKQTVKTVKFIKK